ncbi:hypothetical protein SCUP234_11885 [Seiridium cupressi]|uniref:Uncharacterized protein n=1 Tax=Seiridium unicorne TaxID=138068 RepID=A0ABR2VHT9_9PEZI
MSSRGTYSSSALPMSPTPPSDLPSYARFMHQHTKKQMEEASRSSHRRSSRSSRVAPSMPNGGSSSTASSPSSNGVEYHD